MEILKKKKNLRIIRAGKAPKGSMECISVDGGLLVQGADKKLLEKWEVVTRFAPAAEDIPNLIFGMRAVTFVKSNAIMAVKDLAATGIGGGQVNRIWPTVQALERSAVAIKAAVEDKRYYDFSALRIDKKQHNNDITDEIIAEIKISRFVIADLTGYRGGVYYEAGYARGLGREVILTCRHDWFAGKPDEYKRIHFDVDHFPVIKWEPDKLDVFKEELVNRIRRTIL
jgi:hypothetical protein